MRKNENKFGAMVFALALCLIILNAFKMLSVSPYVIIGFALLIYSVPAVYSAMEKGKRAKIIFSTFIFFTGLLIILVNWFDILNPVKIVFPSLVFVTGIVFLLLYIENSKEKVFLYAGGLTSAIGILIVLFNKTLPLNYYADRIITFTSDYWHILLIGIGIALLLNRKKR